MKNIRSFFIAVCLCFSFSACVFAPDVTPDFAYRPSTTRDKGLAAFDNAQYHQAMKYLYEPAQKGDIDAEYIVGLIYLHGLTGEKNSYAAQKWFTLAANQGHLASQEMLGLIYANRIEPLYNPIDAYHWFSYVVASKPQYQQELQNLRWTLQSRGLLSKATSMRAPRDTSYQGIDYNTLFPYR